MVDVAVVVVYCGSTVSDSCHVVVIVVAVDITVSTIKHYT